MISNRAGPYLGRPRSVVDRAVHCRPVLHARLHGTRRTPRTSAMSRALTRRRRCSSSCSRSDWHRRVRPAGEERPSAASPRATIEPPHVSTDPSVKLDYDIVYVRAPRRGDDVGTNWAEVSSPLFMDAGADLMLLHPGRQRGSAGRGRQGIGRRPHGFVRRRVGLLLALSRPGRGDDHRRGAAPVPTSTRSTSRRAGSFG